jgi:hypothetical protein
MTPTRMPLRRPICCGLSSVILIMASTCLAAAAPDWDRPANIKSAATQIGEIHARGGADTAFKFIVACYKTHGLASKYSKAFEGCIAQDLMLMEVLARIYARVPPEDLARTGVPSPEVLVHSLNQRVGSALAQYKIAPSEGLAIKALVDKHGMPEFLRIVFPPKDGGKSGEAKP